MRKTINTFELLESFLKTNIEDDYLAELNLAESEQDIENTLAVKELNQEKMNIILGFRNQDQTIQTTFFQMFNTFSMRLSNDFMLMRMVLSYGSIISKVKGTHNLDLEDAYFLSAIMMNLNVNEYETIGLILSDKRVLTMILNTTQNMYEVDKVGYELINFLDIVLDETVVYDNNLKETIIEDVLKLIDSYVKDNVR